jgi:NO-binding membrane sensor protein with MHYT domain
MEMPIQHSYDPGLVTLSVLIAMLASYAALDLAGRVSVAAGRARALWILGGATGMGLGIWSMHFVGMLAFQMPMPVKYAPSLVFASVVVAITATAFALWTASRPSVRLPHLAAAAVAMGGGIAGMHYIGMAAMDVNATLHYDPALWWTSIAIAVAASFVALNLFRLLSREESRRMRLLRGAAAVVMGFAIAGMHYTGMAAAHFTSAPGSPVTAQNDIDNFVLVVAVILAALIGIGITLLAAMMDRIVRARTVEAELRAAKDAAEETTRAKSEFLSNMSHELRTPLNSVIGFANVILKNKAGNLRPQDIAYLGRIVANGRHLLGLINGILDLSKIEAGKVELQLETVDIGALVRETVLELEGQVHGRELQLVADVPDDLDSLETDRAKLKQIVINLVGNALKFTEKGSVSVRVISDERTGRPTRVDVVDTGVGIPADRLDAMFEAFKQADSSTSRVYGGTGLGLTITRSLAQLMGFDVRVESTPGFGSTFSLLLEPWGASNADPVLKDIPVGMISVVAGENRSGVDAGLTAGLRPRSEHAHAGAA